MRCSASLLKFGCVLGNLPNPLGLFSASAPSKISRMNLAYDSQGLIPAIVQDAATGAVLMVAWMNAESLRLTQEKGEAVFWSRSRGELWHKGATSGNVMRVKLIRVDCDGDTLLLFVDPAGPACHTGERSCFYRSLAEFQAASEGD